MAGWSEIAATNRTNLTTRGGTSSVILATGAGTGIGKLSAQALAEAGHIVYATMRDIDGRNQARADAVRAFAEQKGV
jgi:NAD(P)-dependent dehydrogenase (short-subunit alcohol dehydrogenase family)